MAFRLGDYVIFGDLRNTENYSTHGIIVLRGEEPEKPFVLRLELTGNCDPDLAGKAIRFEPADATEAKVFPRDAYTGLQDRQIGPTGSMTADGWVRTFDCPVSEYAQRASLGEPPPTVWKRHLYLEWYSQNGRVLVELAGPNIYECVREGEGFEDDGDWEPLPHLAPIPEHGKGNSGPSITLFERYGDEIYTETFNALDEDSDDGDEASELQRTLDADAAAVDRAIRRGHGLPDDEDDEETERAIREMELLDDCIENRDPTSMAPFIDGIENLKPADELDDIDVEGELKGLLMQLALINIALDVCEHYTPRDSYRLLTEVLFKEEDFFPEMIGSGWIQHCSTYEHCAECDAKFEREYKEMNPEG